MAAENPARGHPSTTPRGGRVKPARIVLVLFLGWLVAQFFPSLGYGWPGLIGGCIGVWLLYVLLRSTPERPEGNDTGRD